MHIWGLIFGCPSLMETNCTCLSVLSRLCCNFSCTMFETILINTGQLNGGQQQVYQFQLDDIANVEDIMLTMNWGTNGGISWPADLVFGHRLSRRRVVYSFYDYANQNIAGCISEGQHSHLVGMEKQMVNTAFQHPSTPEQVSIKSSQTCWWNWDLDVCCDQHMESELLG